MGLIYLVASTVYPELRQNRSVEDSLPPFPSLTTDEEREKKAESQDPGTYHVIANPGSFVSLPEYREDDDDPTVDSNRTSAYTPTAFDRDILDAPSGDPLEDSDDPNVVILKVFEEPARKGPAQPSNRSTNFPASPASSQISIPRTPYVMEQDYPHGHGDLSGSMLGTARSGGRDAQLMEHYRGTISPHIFSREIPQRDDDIFETQARTFPPVSDTSCPQ